MSRRLRTLAAGIALGATFIGPVAADPAGACFDRQTLIDLLAERYGEERITFALWGGRLVETFANAGTGTWSMTMTGPDGPACLIASGDSFGVDRPVAGDDA